MVREGRFKYNYIHGHQPQLFDLESDPGEWNNLAGAAEHAATETRLRGLILDRFDPDKMAADNLDSLYRRRLIRDVMYKHDASWNHATTFDPRRGALDQYLPPLSS